MSEQASFFRLGLFVLGSTVLLVAGVATIGARSFLRNSFRAESIFAESTAGLDVGAPVRHRGVKVGSVSRIAFAGREYAVQDPVQAGLVVVEMKLDDLGLASGPLPAHFPALVDAGLRARVATSGLVGPTYVELAFVDPGTNPPLALPWKPHDLYVPSTPSFAGRVQSAAESLAVKLNQAGIDTLVRDLDALARDSRQALSGVQGTVKAVDGVLADAGVAAAKAERIAVRLDPGTVARTLENLARASEDLPGAASDLRRLVRRLDALLATEHADLEAILTGLRQLTEDASRNPSRALFGKPPPRRAAGEPP